MQSATSSATGLAPLRRAGEVLAKTQSSPSKAESATRNHSSSASSPSGSGAAVLPESPQSSTTLKIQSFPSSTSSALTATPVTLEFSSSSPNRNNREKKQSAQLVLSFQGQATASSSPLEVVSESTVVKKQKTSPVQLTEQTSSQDSESGSDACKGLISEQQRASPNKGKPEGRPKEGYFHSPTGTTVAVPYPLRKVGEMIQKCDLPRDAEAIVLLQSGAYNPIHLMHIRAFHLARQFLEHHFENYIVIGGIISPCHDTYVRQKTRNTPNEMIPAPQRLRLAELVSTTSSWIEVDKWEITRRRTMDYLSTLKHVREVLCKQFPSLRFRVMYLCGPNAVFKTSHSALKSEGFEAVVVVRPSQLEGLQRYLNPKWEGILHIVEDRSVVPAELDGTSSFKVRQGLMTGRPVANMVGTAVIDYMMQESFADHLSGKAKWAKHLRVWRPEDTAYAVDFTSNELGIGEGESETE